MSLQKTFNEIKGSASLAVYFREIPNLLLSTNTGALFYLSNSNNSFFAFASEKFILKKLAKRKDFQTSIGEVKLSQLKAFSALNLNINTLENHTFSLTQNLKLDNNCLLKETNQQKINNSFEIKDHSSSSVNLKRCKKCVLPETYPYVDLDAKGVCRYCREHKPIKIKGEKLLLDEIQKYKSSNGEPDCIVALSGGRDSCYGLHYIKKS